MNLYLTEDISELKPEYIFLGQIHPNSFSRKFFLPSNTLKAEPFYKGCTYAFLLLCELKEWKSTLNKYLWQHENQRPRYHSIADDF